MGFFYATKAKAKKTRTSPKTPTTKPSRTQDLLTLNRLGCRACPLDKAKNLTPKMKPIIPNDTKFYFLGEAPNKEEDENGKPFESKQGKILFSLIPKEYKRLCAFDYIVRDYPTAERKPTWQEYECCRNYVVEDIAKAKPDIIIGFGPIVLNWAIKTTVISDLRGRYFAVDIGGHHCWFYPVYDIDTAIQKAWDKSKPLYGQIGSALRMDIDRMFMTIDELRRPKIQQEQEIKENITIINGKNSEDLNLLETLINEACKATTSCIDLETQNLRPYKNSSKILTAAISYLVNKEIKTFAFAYHHPKAGWDYPSIQKVRDLFLKYLKNPKTKVAHNAPFELEWLISEFGYDFIQHDLWADTMMQAHIINEKRGQSRGESERAATYQSLDFLYKQHFGVNLKQMFKLDKKNMEKEDLDTILLYDGCDAKCTLQLFLRQRNLIRKEQCQGVFEDAQARAATVALMQTLGLPVDQKKVREFTNNLEKEIEDINNKINEIKVVKQYIKDKGAFNPLSQPETLEIFRDYLKRSEIYVSRKDYLTFDNNSKFKKELRLTSDAEPAKAKVDRDVLEKIDHPLAKLIVKLRTKTKMKSTYVDVLSQDMPDTDPKKVLMPDKKIHTSFNLTLTETGRVSSDAPNMQNFPKRNNSYIREQVVAEKGCIMIAVDYNQLEYCTTAMCTKDPKIVDSIWEQYDIHMDWAIKLAEEHPEYIGGKKYLKDENVMKDLRSKVKSKLVFPAIFGASNSSIANYLSIDEYVITKLMDRFREQHEGLVRWQNKTITSYYNKGYTSTLVGRRRRYPLTKNQIYNHPIQGTAAEIVCKVMSNLSKLALEKDMMHIHPNVNIHDDLTFTKVPDKESVIEDSINIISKEMLRKIYDFMNVPMGIEIMLGYNWAPYDKVSNPEGLQKVGLLFSNKDL